MHFYKIFNTCQVLSNIYKNKLNVIMYDLAKKYISIIKTKGYHEHIKSKYLLKLDINI